MRLKNHPACIATEGGISVEMGKRPLSHMPDNKGIKAQKFLEINTNHPVYAALETANKDGDNTFAAMARVLYNQALLIEGLTVKDPVAFSNDIWEIMKG